MKSLKIEGGRKRHPIVSPLPPLINLFHLGDRKGSVFLSPPPYLFKVHLPHTWGGVDAYSCWKQAPASLSPLPPQHFPSFQAGGIRGENQAISVHFSLVERDQLPLSNPWSTRMGRRAATFSWPSILRLFPLISGALFDLGFCGFFLWGGAGWVASREAERLPGLRFCYFKTQAGRAGSGSVFRPG